MRGEVPTIRPAVPKPRGDAEWFAETIGGLRPTLHHANRQSSICNHQFEAVYEYDVYGQVAASDPNHPNRFMFTGREFDTETGLYYYRARYYNPTIGRFLQTDPIGYADGMNTYTYCHNDPVGCSDPSGALALVSPDAPWYSWPYTRDRGCAPLVPSTWSINDFFNYYRYGPWLGGAPIPVSLKEIGLFERFEGSVTDILNYKGRMIEYAHDLAVTTMEKDQSSAAYVETFTIKYDFARNWVGLIGMLATSNPLVVLGGGEVVAYTAIKVTQKADAEGHAIDVWEYEVDILFSMSDSFSDPGDFFDYSPEVLEWAGCAPYEIYQSWTWGYAGQVAPGKTGFWD
jgi:RHS repeat-associated protein